MSASDTAGEGAGAESTDGPAGAAAGPRYVWLRRMLHWAVAILVIGLVPSGLVMSYVDRSAVDGLLGTGAKNVFYDLHKSAGLTVLGLMILRVVARATWPNPAYSPPLGPVTRRLSHAVHAALYALLIITPIIGWLGVSLFPAPATFWYVWDLRLPVGEWRDASIFLLGWGHGPLALLIGILAAVHILAALKHRLTRRDRVWERMVPAKG